jgi:hypothetical protein
VFAASDFTGEGRCRHPNHNIAVHMRELRVVTIVYGGRIDAIRQPQICPRAD